MSELADLTDALKREVAVPGTFATVFPNTTDEDLEGTLLDAFAQCQLDGFMLDIAIDDDGVTAPDITRGQQALVVIYAGCRMLMAELLNRKSHTRYEANGSVFEQDQAASMLTQALKDLQEKKQRLWDLAQRRPTSVTVVDGYFIKATDFYWPTPGGGVGSHDPFGGW